jgi:ATP-dependent DNA ligase
LETDESPFNAKLPNIDAKGVTFVRPELVGEVRYSERTSDGRLRQPSWRGLRPDKSPDEVRWES